MAVQYLKKYGHAVLDNGYEVVGITPGTKHPSYDYSVKALPTITHEHLSKLISNGHENDGLGIRTRFTPMFDIDSTHKPTVAECVKDAEDVIGYAPSRIGNAPKTGLIFRSVDPFKKVTSKAFTDPDGNKAQVEFLGDGQQFVAFAIHPDTKKKYLWPDKGWNPFRMKHNKLQIVTQEQALECVQRFEKRCMEQGWSRWGGGKSTALTTIGTRDPDDDMTGKYPLGLPIDEVRDWVERLDNDDSVNYEEGFRADPEKPNYLNVLFAIWHETEGSEEGRQIALEWSEESPKHEQEPGRFFKIWNSADPEGRDDPVTFRYVIKCVLIQEGEQRKELRDNHLESLRACIDPDDLQKLTKLISKTKFVGQDFERLAQAVKAAFGRICGFSLSIGTARKEIYHEPEENDVPAWIKDWVYIRHMMVFHNRETGEQLQHKAYDAAYSRYLGGASAVEFALHQAKIKTYSVPMYKPNDDEEFVFNGMECINTFSERLMPEIPEKFSKKDLIAIAIIEAHAAHLIPDARERGIFFSWLAYVVQTYSRPNWAVVLQGVEGDGKSFFSDMMGAVLGGTPNVRVLDAKQLEASFTAWAIGQLLTVVPELKIQGHNRYDVVNQIKPLITDNVISIHPKNIDQYVALNTTAYFATTNHKDALPMTENDRRWFILYSAMKSGDQVRAFEADNPGYTDRLFATLDDHPGAIRKWLMEYKLHPEFKAKGRAPETRARADMIDLGKSELQLAFEEVIRADNEPQISSDLVVSSTLVKYLYDHTEEKETLNRYGVSRFLSGYGYEKLKFRVRVNGPENKEGIWVKDRSSFYEKDETRQNRGVKKFLRGRQLYLNHKNEI